MVRSTHCVLALWALVLLASCVSTAFGEEEDSFSYQSSGSKPTNGISIDFFHNSSHGFSPLSDAMNDLDTALSCDGTLVLKLNNSYTGQISVSLTTVSGDIKTVTNSFITFEDSSQGSICLGPTGNGCLFNPEEYIGSDELLISAEGVDDSSIISNRISFKIPKIVITMTYSPETNSLIIQHGSDLEVSTVENTRILCNDSHLYSHAVFKPEPHSITESVNDGKLETKYTFSGTGLFKSISIERTFYNGATKSVEWDVCWVPKIIISELRQEKSYYSSGDGIKFTALFKEIGENTCKSKPLFVFSYGPTTNSTEYVSDPQKEEIFTISEHLTDGDYLASVGVSYQEGGPYTYSPELAFTVCNEQPPEKPELIFPQGGTSVSSYETSLDFKIAKPSYEGSNCSINSIEPYFVISVDHVEHKQAYDHTQVGNEVVFPGIAVNFGPHSWTSWMIGRDNTNSTEAVVQKFTLCGPPHKPTIISPTSGTGVSIHLNAAWVLNTFGYPCETINPSNSFKYCLTKAQGEQKDVFLSCWEVSGQTVQITLNYSTSYFFGVVASNGEFNNQSDVVSFTTEDFTPKYKWFYYDTNSGEDPPVSVASIPENVNELTLVYPSRACQYALALDWLEEEVNYDHVKLSWSGGGHTGESTIEHKNNDPRDVFYLDSDHFEGFNFCFANLSDPYTFTVEFLQGSDSKTSISKTLQLSSSYSTCIDPKNDISVSDFTEYWNDTASLSWKYSHNSNCGCKLWNVYAANVDSADDLFHSNNIIGTLPCDPIPPEYGNEGHTMSGSFSVPFDVHRLLWGVKMVPCLGTSLVGDSTGALCPSHSIPLPSSANHSDTLFRFVSKNIDVVILVSEVKDCHGDNIKPVLSFPSQVHYDALPEYQGSFAYLLTEHEFGVGLNRVFWGANSQNSGPSNTNSVTVYGAGTPAVDILP